MNGELQSSLSLGIDHEDDEKVQESSLQQSLKSSSTGQSQAEAPQQDDVVSARVTSDYQENNNNYRIALYYCYIVIPDLKQHCQFHVDLCNRLDLQGRIRVAPEGINGVLSGTLCALQEYDRDLQKALKQLHSTKDTTLSTTPINSQMAMDWELDVKYCQLRSDLPLSSQLFDTLVVNETKTVVSLIGTTYEEKKAQKKNKRRQRRVVPNGQRDGEVAAAATPTQSLARYTETIYARGLEILQPAVRLSPQEWEQRLLELEASSPSTNPALPATRQKKVVLLDCRNVYESNVGYFQVPHAETILTNTRKYSELPQVLVEQVDRLAASDEIFMYCTGGVRCERASVFLQSLLNDYYCYHLQHQPQQRPIPAIYQLQGGIQRYLESQATSIKQTVRDNNSCLFQGKNFVFDPRRTDPIHNGRVVGQCLVCQKPHDDFDNGAPPCANQEARCWNCRVLILVCDQCRWKVSCWNDAEQQENSNNNNNSKPRVYCGGVGGNCYPMMPVKVIGGGQSSLKY